MTEALMASFNRMWTLFSDKLVFFFPRLLAALVVIAVGWALAVVARAVLLRFLRLIQFEVRCERSGFALLFRRAGIPWPPGASLGKLAYGGILLCALVLSLSALDMTVMDHLVSAFFLYLPNLVVAAVILTLGFVLGNFLSRAALLAAINRELPAARLIGDTVRFLIGLLAVTMAMEQVGVARGTVTAAFAIAFGGIVLGLALAFGLGGRELAKELLERRFRSPGPEDSSRMTHL